MDKPLIEMDRQELGVLYKSEEIDILRELIAFVGLRNKYLSMTTEQLREEYKAERNNSKKELIKQIGLHKTQSND